MVGAVKVPITVPGLRDTFVVVAGELTPLRAWIDDGGCVNTLLITAINTIPITVTLPALGDAAT